MKVSTTAKVAASTIQIRVIAKGSLNHALEILEFPWCPDDQDADFVDRPGRSVETQFGGLRDQRGNGCKGADTDLTGKQPDPAGCHRNHLAPGRADPRNAHVRGQGTSRRSLDFNEHRLVVGPGRPGVAPQRTTGAGHQRQSYDQRAWDWCSP